MLVDTNSKKVLKNTRKLTFAKTEILEGYVEPHKKNSETTKNKKGEARPSTISRE